MASEKSLGTAQISLEDQKLNDFATRCFRDTADCEYIAARLCWHTGLFAQFRWQALHALEKYLKAILLYNRVPARKTGHSLSKALEKCKSLPFTIRRSDSSNRFIDSLDQTARFRYLEVSYFISGPALLELDKAVWEIRRYCRVLAYDIRGPDGSIDNMLESQLRAIEQSERNLPQMFQNPGGLLERIVADRKHPSRAALIRHNGFFGTQRRRSFTATSTTMAVNSPLYLHPEILDTVRKYVYLPDDVVKAFLARNAARDKA